jgi:hypothetical protein
MKGIAQRIGLVDLGVTTYAPITRGIVDSTKGFR